MPVLMLVGGLGLLVVGLVLLTGGLHRRPASSDVEPTPRPEEPPPEPRVVPAATRPIVVVPPTATPTPTLDGVPVPAPTCDWTAWLEDDRGERTLLRAATGRACCAYVLRVRDLDPVTGPRDELDEVVAFSGSATRLTAEGATTPLQRDLVARRVGGTAGLAVTALSLDRAPGPEVHTPSSRIPPADPAAPPPPPEHDPRTAQLWGLHIDDLRDHGARPRPADAPQVTPVEHRRRVEATLHVERGCDQAPRRGEVSAACRARLASRHSPGVRRLATPLLAGWVETPARVVAADRPTVPPTGLTDWHPTLDAPARGVAATCAPAADTAEAEWDGSALVTVDPDAVTLVIGTAVRLEVEADDRGDVSATAEIHASVEAHARLDAAPDPDDPGQTAGCRRCLAHVEVVLGRPDAPLDTPTVRPGTPSSTAGATIRLDGVPHRLVPPVPGSGSRSWTVAEGDRTPLGDAVGVREGTR